MSCRKPSAPDGSRVSTAKPLPGVSAMGTGPSAVSIMQSPASPRDVAGAWSVIGLRTIDPRHDPGKASGSPLHRERQLPAIADALDSPALRAGATAGPHHPHGVV